MWATTHQTPLATLQGEAWWKDLMKKASYQCLSEFLHSYQLHLMVSSGCSVSFLCTTTCCHISSIRDNSPWQLGKISQWKKTTRGGRKLQKKVPYLTSSFLSNYCVGGQSLTFTVNGSISYLLRCGLLGLWKLREGQDEGWPSLGPSSGLHWGGGWEEDVSQADINYGQPLSPSTWDCRGLKQLLQQQTASPTV